MEVSPTPAEDVNTPPARREPASIPDADVTAAATLTKSARAAERADGVQSVQRALDLIETIHRRGGELGISELAAEVSLPLPTIHRLLRTLAGRGYVRQLPNRRYALGFRIVPLADAAQRTVGTNARALLTRLVAAVGETANLAVISGDRAQYVAHVPSHHEMRTFTETGQLVDLHATGVGKALLAVSDPTRIARVASGELHRHTARTISSATQLLDALAEIRQRGYALDDEEQAIGVRCVAVTLDGELSWIAVSVSGPTARMTDRLIARAVPLLEQAARELGADIRGSSAEEGRR